MGISIPSLIGQMVTFGLFVWFVMRFVWPPVTTALRERQQRIADGLAAADKGARSLEEAREQIAGMIRDTRAQAADILNQANKRSTEIVEEAKGEARKEGERLVAAARAQIQMEVGQAREALRREVAALAVAGAKQILEREIDPKAHADLLDKVAKQLN